MQIFQAYQASVIAIMKVISTSSIMKIKNERSKDSTEFLSIRAKVSAKRDPPQICSPQFE